MTQSALLSSHTCIKLHVSHSSVNNGKYDAVISGITLYIVVDHWSSVKHLLYIHVLSHYVYFVMSI